MRELLTDPYLTSRMDSAFVALMIMVLDSLRHAVESVSLSIPTVLLRVTYCRDSVFKERGYCRLPFGSFVPARDSSGLLRNGTLPSAFEAAPPVYVHIGSAMRVTGATAPRTDFEFKRFKVGITPCVHAAGFDAIFKQCFYRVAGGALKSSAKTTDGVFNVGVIHER